MLGDLVRRMFVGKKDQWDRLVTALQEREWALKGSSAMAED